MPIPGVKQSAASRLVIFIPLLWLTAFFLIPALIVLKISFSQTVIAQPPYTPVLELAEGWEGIKRFAASLSWENYKALIEDRLYLASYLKACKSPPSPPCSCC